MGTGLAVATVVGIVTGAEHSFNAEPTLVTPQTPKWSRIVARTGGMSAIITTNIPD
jgi:hypothetical protein